MTPIKVVGEDGRKYVLVPVKDTATDKVGRQYIMEKLGITKSSLSRAPWDFPDFGVKLRNAHRGAKPYTRKEVDDWLSIPQRIRKKRYIEWREKNNEDNQ